MRIAVLGSNNDTETSENCYSHCPPALGLWSERFIGGLDSYTFPIWA